MSPPLRTFFIDRPLQKGIFEITGSEARHITGSFRMVPGDEIVLINNSGRKGIAEILSIHKDTVKVRVFEVSEEKVEGPQLTLAVSVPKEKRMDWLLEKCTELGVHAVIPTVFRNSVVRPRGGRHAKADKWKRVVLEATKQCGRATFLSVPDFMAFLDLLDFEADLKVLLRPEAKTVLADLLADEAPSQVLVVVGPEGGTDLSEEKEAVAKGFRMAGLTPTTLRIETAAVAAAAVVLARGRAAWPQ